MAISKRLIDILAENVQILLDQSGLSVTAFAGKAGLDKNTIKNILTRKNSAQIDTIEAIARAYRVDAAQLLMEDGHVQALLSAFKKTDESGRESILKVAEIAARYRV